MMSVEYGLETPDPTKTFQRRPRSPGAGPGGDPGGTGQAGTVLPIALEFGGGTPEHRRQEIEDLKRKLEEKK